MAFPGQSHGDQNCGLLGTTGRANPAGVPPILFERPFLQGSSLAEVLHSYLDIWSAGCPLPCSEKQLPARSTLHKERLVVSEVAGALGPASSQLYSWGTGSIVVLWICIGVIGSGAPWLSVGPPFAANSWLLVPRRFGLTGPVLAGPVQRSVPFLFSG